MRNKCIFLIFISMIFVSLSACGNKSEKLKHPYIESSSVEIGSKQNRGDGNLHFLVRINEYAMEPEQKYKVRFVIQENYISDLVATDKIEIPEIYETMPVQNDEKYAIFTGAFRKMKKEFTVDEIKKYIEKDQAVIVELYDGNRTITREVITTFVDNRSEPLVKINSEAKIEHIDLKETNEIALFRTAVSDSNKEPGIVYIVSPEYIFSLGEESYFLWITEDYGSIADGKIMNTKDTYTIYSLSNSSLKEVKEFIKKSQSY